LFSFLIVLGINAYTCPDYEDIRQPSVDASVFDIADFSGVWYMIATNEPTLPPFCTCGVNTVDVHKSDGWYSYTNTDTCGGAVNISVPIKGDLSSDPNSPGYLMENFGAFNHTSKNLDPNMIFNATYNGDSLDMVLTYACISKNLFSFNVLSRTNLWSAEDIEDIINNADALTGGQLKVSGMRIADEAAYDACGMV
jgi:hypothetical protein